LLKPDPYKRSSKLRLSPKSVAIDPNIIVLNISPKQPYKGVRYKEPFNPLKVDHFVELVESRDVGTVAKKVEKAVGRSTRQLNTQERTIHTAMQNDCPTTWIASKWNKLFELAVLTVGTMFVPTHVIAKASVVMHPGETCSHNLGLVHE
jgi:hypothetical protein